VNLAPGDYVVNFNNPNTSHTPVTQDSGSDDTIDSDINASGNTVSTNLESGETDNTLDAGYSVISSASLGDFVWEDSDADGIQDSGEVGIDGVTVNLYFDADNNGSITGAEATTPFATTTTGDDASTTGTTEQGWYEFDGLAAGNYIVEFVHSSTALSGYYPSPQDAGGNSTNNLTTDISDSDGDVVTGRTDLIALSTSHNPGIDAGFHELANIGNYVWLEPATIDNVQ
jgi:serine-aspartate repeat-containing protein C/D/E